MSFKSIKQRTFTIIKYVGRKVLLSLGVLMLILLLLVGGISMLIVNRQKDPFILHNSVLVLRIDGALPDYANADPWATRFLGTPSRSLTGMIEQLKKAKIDNRIGAIILDMRSFDAGWAKADELRDAIFDYRKAGKPIFAYIETNADKEYYISVACDRVYMAPVGDLLINGLDAEMMFYRGAFDKFGVYVDNFQIGKYKNAPEQYTRKEMSEGQREVTNSLLDQQFTRYVQAIAQARNRSDEDVRALIDQAPLTASVALKEGLVDATYYRTDVENVIKKLLRYKDSEKLPQLSYGDYQRVQPETLGLNQGERIAVVYASGAIGPGASSESTYFDDSIAGSDTLVKAIEDARDDDTIKAIVLRVDSPGGTTTSSDLIWGAVESAKKKKPVVVSMGDHAASGGYYISVNANRIVAQPSTLTGSIGVYSNKPVFKGLFDMLGVTTDHISRGKNAALFRNSEPFTTEERAQFEAKLKSFYYDVFLPKVATGRNGNVEYVDSIAQGRVWTGAQAKELGLIDEFGGLERAVELAAELASIPKDKGIERVVFPAGRTLFQKALGLGEKAESDMPEQTMIDALPQDMRRTLKYTPFFNRVKRGEMLIMMPYDLEIK